MQPVTTTKEREMKQIKSRFLALAASSRARYQEGKLGYILAWLLGIPLPILFVIFLLRGCN
jgi:hypothetical protein